MIEIERYMGSLLFVEMGLPKKPGLLDRVKFFLSTLGITFSDGVDVSKWQEYMLWLVTKARGARFAYIKMTQGTSIKDADAIENMKNSKGLLLRGGYHFLSASVSGAAQADYMIDFMLNEVGDMGELPLCLDVEINVDASIVKAFVLRVLERLGYYPVIYTSVGAWDKVIGDKSWASACPLWAAHWYVETPSIPAPWLDYVLHQYSNQGNGSEWGASSTFIDLDRGKDSWLNLYVPPPPPDEIVPIETVVISTWTASLRNLPSVASNEVGRMTKAQRLPVTKVSEDGNYVKVEAWISLSNVKEVI